MVWHFDKIDSVWYYIILYNYLNYWFSILSQHFFTSWFYQLADVLQTEVVCGVKISYPVSILLARNTLLVWTSTTPRLNVYVHGGRQENCVKLFSCAIIFHVCMENVWIPTPLIMCASAIADFLDNDVMCLRHVIISLVLTMDLVWVNRCIVLYGTRY